MYDTNSQIGFENNHFVKGPVTQRERMNYAHIFISAQSMHVRVIRRWIERGPSLIVSFERLKKYPSVHSVLVALKGLLMCSSLSIIKVS